MTASDLHHLHYRPAKVPRRPLRGARRYFREVQRKAEQFTVEPDDSSWWQYWHYHADWPGWGNRGWRHRFGHLRALCRVFRTIADARDRFRTPFQTWIQLHEQDAGQDAVYLHTPNPHAEFPAALHGRRGRSSLEPLLQPLLPGLVLELAFSEWRARDDDEPPLTRITTIWARGVGVPPLF